MKNLLVIILFFVVAISCQRNDETQFDKNPVIAHRGAWKNTGLPQNSLASLRAAIDLGCQGSEFDVHLTADDSLIVYHDRTHHGMVIDSTVYRDLVKILLGNGEKIPTLREYLLEGMKQKNTKLIIDIKTPENKLRTNQIAEKALELVELMNAQAWVEFLAGDLSVAETLQNKTTLPVAFLGNYKAVNEDMIPENIFKQKLKSVDYMYIHYQNNPEWIASFKDMGISLNAWTVNNASDMVWFIKQEFDYITTDEPELLLKLCKSY